MHISAGKSKDKEEDAGSVVSGRVCCVLWECPTSQPVHILHPTVEFTGKYASEWPQE